MPEESEEKKQIPKTGKYDCPHCGDPFDKTIKRDNMPGVYCPNCNTRLVVQRGRDPESKKFTITYRVDEANVSWRPVYSEKEVIEKDVVVPKEVFTADGANPQVVLMSDETYRVIFIRPALGRLIRCPSCRKVVWENQSLVGQANYDCPRCKTFTCFMFLRDGNIASVMKILTVP